MSCLSPVNLLGVNDFCSCNKLAPLTSPLLVVLLYTELLCFLFPHARTHTHKAKKKHTQNSC